MEVEEPGECWVDSRLALVRPGRKHRRSPGCWLEPSLAVTHLLIFHNTFKNKDNEGKSFFNRERLPGAHTEGTRAGSARHCASVSPCLAGDPGPAGGGGSNDENLCLGKTNYRVDESEVGPNLPPLEES